MLKNILNLEGAQELSKNEQKVVKGGLRCGVDGYCPGDTVCVGREIDGVGDCKLIKGQFYKSPDRFQSNN